MTRALRAALGDELARAGFEFGAARTAWRHHADRVDVLQLPSFNRALADGLGITPFSFAANLGCHLRYIPPWVPLRTDAAGRIRPAEHECHFRGALVPTLARDRAADVIWSVAPDGANLARCVDDLAQQLPAALAWFARFDAPGAVLHILQESREQMPALWGFGAPGSPVRAYLSGYVALAFGDVACARAALTEAVRSGCFETCFTSVEAALALRPAPT
ncbi:MAG: hypothetical protein RLW62_13580 [Gammaproteobacteria bacterium]